MKAISFRHRSLPLIAAGLSMFVVGPLHGQHEPLARDQHSACYRYDTPGTALEGTLIERRVFGPPGYGETPARDSHETILVLRLSQSISVEPATNAEANGSVNLDPAEKVHEVQLFVDGPQRQSVHKLISRRVVVTGTLNESITASQYTKVWLDVAAFSLK